MPRSTRPHVSPTPDDHGLTGAARTHLRAILAAKDLSPAQIPLAVEAARLHGLLEQAWADYGGGPTTLLLNNGAYAPHPALGVIDRAQRGLIGIYRTLGIRPIDLAGSEPDDGADDMEELLRVVR